MNHGETFGGSRMHQETAGMVADLEHHLGIEVEVDEVHSRGFDGAEVLVYMITAFAGGVTSGMLSKMGEDLWLGIRKIAGSLRTRGKAAKIVVVVVQDGPDGQVRFRCELDDATTAGEVAEAFRAALTDFERGTAVRVLETEDGTEIRFLQERDSH